VETSGKRRREKERNFFPKRFTSTRKYILVEKRFNNFLLELERSFQKQNA